MTVENPQAGWRTRLGLLLFVVSIGWPVLIPILPLFGVSGKMIAALSAVMVVAAEVMMIAGAAVAGKEGFVFIKSKVFGIFKPYLPPQKVSRLRYTIGLVLFSSSLVLGWAWPYLRHYLPGFERAQLISAVAGDVVLLTSLFVLGGGFWDKLRALFRYDDVSVATSSDSETEPSNTELPE
jgi:hypothetical protein